MKLNIGCGKKYLPDYVNIDFFDKIIADKNLKCWELPYKEDSVDSIIAEQLLEHIGYVGAKFALSEWFRVLTPNGHLSLTTPSFDDNIKAYSEASSGKKAALLNWIFGMEYEGYQHKFCFSKEILRKELAKAGFADIKISQFECGKDRVSFRVECKKPEKYDQKYSVVSALRRTFVAGKIIDPQNVHPVKIELENLIDKILQIDVYSKESVFELLYDSIILSPHIGRIVFDVFNSFKLFPTDSVKKLKIVIPYLIKNNFILQLYSFFVGSSNYISDNVENYLYACESAKSYLKSLQKIPLNKLSKGIFCFRSVNKLPYLKVISMFDLSHIFYIAASLSAQGAKAFIQKKNKEAKNLFDEALKFNPKNIFACWNMARLCILNGNLLGAIDFYSKSLMGCSPYLKEDLLKELNAVLRKNRWRGYNKPVIYDESKI